MRRKEKTEGYAFGRAAMWLVGAHVVCLLMLSLMRAVQYVALHGMMGRDTATTAVPAFMRGLWFDNVVGCWALVVPLAAVLVAAALGGLRRWMLRAAVMWLCLADVLMIAASAANIPYYAYFAKVINSSIFNWFGYAGTTAGMIAGDGSYVFYAALAVAAAVLLVCLQRKWFGLCWNGVALPPRGRQTWAGRLLRLLPAAALTGLCVFGIRGRTGYNPIKISEAYYCNDAFLNQLGIAPMFNLLTSVMDDMRPENRALRLMPDAEAIGVVRASLGITGPTDSLHVLRRNGESVEHTPALGSTAGMALPNAPNATPQASHTPFAPNVVVILMESMSASLMATFGNEGGLTPTLDSLYETSLAFTRCYSAGIHTNHGITASLYSFPALMKRNLMKGTVTPRREGLPTVLKERGYKNYFFLTHEAQYDNMKAFLLTNGYDRVFAQEDYPAEARVNAFGVNDEFLFDYALKTLRQLPPYTPFHATLLTVSNHPPYVVPDDFKARSSEKEQQIVEYADRCVGEFLKRAKEEVWFDNTIFVLVGDHGKLVGTDASALPESYNHVPLIIFGKGVSPMRYDQLASQVDIMPTVLGLLGGEYVMDGFGVDLLRTQRAMVSYTADDQIVARDTTTRYIYRPDTDQEFMYGAGDRNQLRRYGLSVVQTAEYMERIRQQKQ